jgi:hypothetical protein
MRFHCYVVPLVQALVCSVREDQAIVHVVLLAPREGTGTQEGRLALHCACSACCVDGRMVQECKLSLPLTAEVL